MPLVVKFPLRHMTVTEFLAWDPDDGSGCLWQLRDGEPEMMAPATDAHASIQGELQLLIGMHLLDRGSHCRAVITPGVVPRLRSDRNMLVPDLAVTCTPASGTHAIPEPVILIEVLSPSNEAKTRGNVWAYTTIPSVMEILVICSFEMWAELSRRGPDGNWPEKPEIIGPDDNIRLASIGFSVPLRAAYRTSGIV